MKWENERTTLIETFSGKVHVKLRYEKKTKKMLKWQFWPIKFVAFDSRKITFELCRGHFYKSYKFLNNWLKQPMIWTKDGNLFHTNATFIPCLDDAKNVIISAAILGISE